MPCIKGEAWKEVGARKSIRHKSNEIQISFPGKLEGTHTGYSWSCQQHRPRKCQNNESSVSWPHGKQKKKGGAREKSDRSFPLWLKALPGRPRDEAKGKTRCQVNWNIIEPTTAGRQAGPSSQSHLQPPTSPGWQLAAGISSGSTSLPGLIRTRRQVVCVICAKPLSLSH